MAGIKKLENIKYGQGCGDTAALADCWGNAERRGHWGNHFGGSPVS